ncbi:hypothetical protein ABW20_dc0103590 [Dactylellina cionopaga]|nr:hypothetical protein ABW20_dc0103590 [Dactylellina cionopaga]
MRWWKPKKLGGCFGTKKQHKRIKNLQHTLSIPQHPPPTARELTIRVSRRFVYQNQREGEEEDSLPPSPSSSTSSTAPLNPPPPQSPKSPNVPSRPVTNLKPTPSTVSLPKKFKRTTTTAAATTSSTPPATPPTTSETAPSTNSGPEFLPSVNTTPFHVSTSELKFKELVGTPPTTPVIESAPRQAQEDKEEKALSEAEIDSNEPVQDPVEQLLLSLSPEQLNREFRKRAAVNNPQSAAVGEDDENSVPKTYGKENELPKVSVKYTNGSPPDLEKGQKVEENSFSSSTSLEDEIKPIEQVVIAHTTVLTNHIEKELAKPALSKSHNHEILQEASTIPLPFDNEEEKQESEESDSASESDEDSEDSSSEEGSSEEAISSAVTAEKGLTGEGDWWAVDSSADEGEDSDDEAEADEEEESGRKEDSSSSEESDTPLWTPKEDSDEDSDNIEDDASDGEDFRPTHPLVKKRIPKEESPEPAPSHYVYEPCSSDEEAEDSNDDVDPGKYDDRFKKYLERITAPSSSSEEEDDPSIVRFILSKNHHIYLPRESILKNPLPATIVMSSIPDTAQAGSSATTATPVSVNPDGGPKKLTGKELKEQKKLEKQARRAAEKSEREGPAIVATPAGHSQKAAQTPTSPGAPQKILVAQAQKAKKTQFADPVAAPEAKKIPFFDHLKEEKPEIDLLKLNKDVHPEIGKLSMKLRNFDIMGSTARCLHMLIAFKEVIKDYTTPEKASLARNLTQHLGIQISQITTGRKLSISQGNAIRWLKTIIIDIKPDVPEREAKDGLLSAIDNYIKERIVAAQEVIARIASDKINNGETILTYAKSSCVERVIRQAVLDGKKFTVVCIDSRPYFEGKQLAKSLSQDGIQVKYTTLHGLAQVMKKVDKVFLGAHGVFANGSCYSRAGTSAVAMTANEFQKPVLICCEGIKLSDKIVLDSITMNELGPPDALVGSDSPLGNHADIPNLHIVNLLYDITLPKYITSVVTEVGQVPPTGIPSVHRLMAEREGTVGAA